MANYRDFVFDGALAPCSTKQFAGDQHVKNAGLLRRLPSASFSINVVSFPIFGGKLLYR